jgi:hypothetical protein
LVNITVVIADGTTQTIVDLTSYGFTATPNVYPVPTQNTGGTFWVTDISASAFTLHVSIAPSGTTFTFYCLVFAGEDLGTVIYGSVAVVKRLCSIDQTDTFADLDIAAFLNIAAYLIDERLEDYESTLPLSPVPSIITVVANYFAAAMYMQKNKPEEAPMHGYWGLADTELTEYIQRKCPVYVGMA